MGDALDDAMAEAAPYRMLFLGLIVLTLAVKLKDKVLVALGGSAEQSK